MHSPFMILDQLAPELAANWRQWQHRARCFAEQIVAPRAAQIDALCQHTPSHFDWEILAQAAPHGFLSMLIPETLGGGGQYTTVMAIVFEELSSRCAGIANIFGASNLGLAAVLLSMDTYHYDRVLREIVRAEKMNRPKLFAAAITEPLAGSDEEDATFLRTAKLMTAAKPVPGGYLINGRKVFISNGSVAEFIALVAPLDKKRPVETQSAFLLRAGTPGLSVGRIESKMGVKACPTAELIFEDCFVATEDRIGNEGDGVPLTERVLGGSRGPVAAIATGIARGALAQTRRLAGEIRYRGKALVDEQHIQLELADMARKVDLARQSYLAACLRFDLEGIPKLMRHPASRALFELTPSALRRSGLVTRALRSTPIRSLLKGLADQLTGRSSQREIQCAASMAKVSASDLALEVCYQGLQIVGLEGAASSAVGGSIVSAQRMR